jgi:hypothetical protein
LLPLRQRVSRLSLTKNVCALLEREVGAAIPTLIALCHEEVKPAKEQFSSDDPKSKRDVSNSHFLSPACALRAHEPRGNAQPAKSVRQSRALYCTEQGREI